jgi:hypothetical protein
MSEQTDHSEVHVTPETASDEPTHQLDGFCWCQPLAEVEIGGVVYIHRRTLDSPHIETDSREGRTRWKA